MALSGWFYSYFESEYFAPVWFAPADESHLTPEETTGGSGKGSRGKRPTQVYVKRGKDILVFSNDAQARAYVEAQKAIEEAQKPKQYPKKKKKKVKEEIKEVIQENIQPEEIISIDYVRLILERYSVPVPSFDQFEVNALMSIYNHALHIEEINRINRELEEEDDIELLLLMEA